MANSSSFGIEVKYKIKNISCVQHQFQICFVHFSIFVTEEIGRWSRKSSERQSIRKRFLVDIHYRHYCWDMQATPIQYIFPRVYSYTLYKIQSIFHGTILSYLSTDESSGGEQIQINYYTLDNIHILWFQLRFITFKESKLLFLFPL